MAEWTEDKTQRIARLTERLDQINKIQQNNYKLDPPRIDATLAKTESELLRKIAEELGDIPKTTTETPTQEPLTITIDSNTNE